jgi:hypothetical protein
LLQPRFNPDFGSINPVFGSIMADAPACRHTVLTMNFIRNGAAA